MPYLQHYAALCQSGLFQAAYFHGDLKAVLQTLHPGCFMQLHAENLKIKTGYSVHVHSKDQQPALHLH
jgi:hypothetical protein